MSYTAGKEKRKGKMKLAGLSTLCRQANSKDKNEELRKKESMKKKLVLLRPIKGGNAAEQLMRRRVRGKLL